MESRLPRTRARSGRGTATEALERRLPNRSSAASHGQLTIFLRRIALLGASVVGLLLLGMIGLALTEDVGLWYAFRWALDTAATVGGFPQPRSTGGQIIHVALIVVGVGTLFYALATVAEFFVAGHLGDLLAARRTQKMIDSLNDHHIICGFGRVGRQVARDLNAARSNYVVVDANPESRPRAEALGVRLIEGDATDDAVLEQAGIQRARSIIACADSDANNVFIALTARELRSDIVIVARAANEDTEKKLKRAGADRVISPYKSSGTEMARLALHPQLSGVVDVDVEYRMEEIVVNDSCEAVGQTLDDIRGGAMIVGLRRGPDFQPQPPPETALQAGDVIVAMGTPTTLERLEALLQTAR
ncbi:MAG TPA: TrkA family potassium uptake protein [Solirubrobacteraceae bacterium]|jgi:voltage-gated potassium channel|nr:TrkA family potassium uptake protein [Solirubrobacteraceae bacterium]